MIAACGQTEATTMDQAGNVWLNIERLAALAAEAKADLFVLPETAYPAYHLESVERYMQSDIERSEQVLERLAKLAAKHALWLVAGFVEEDQGKLYNSAAVFDRSGSRVGIARKNFMWDCDFEWFTPGESLATFDTEFGRMGVLICADARAPEIPATLVNDGAQFLVQPTAWVNATEVRRTYRNIQPDFLIRNRAMEFGVPWVCSSKAGREGSVLEYVGQSRIVSADGNVLAEAPLGGEHMVAAEFEPAAAHHIEIDDTLRRRLMSSEPPYQPEKPGKKCKVRLRQAAEAIAAELKSAGNRAARLTTAELKSFAPARCYALDGTAVLVVQGRILDDSMVRSRAAENRVFVIAATDTGQMVVDPDGHVVWRRTDWNDTLEIDLALAELKQFNPRTHLWHQRRVACYRLAAAETGHADANPA